jgi:hypothetical protein
MKKNKPKKDLRREWIRKDAEKKAEARRKLLAKMDPETQEYAIQEFAKLGLYQ